MDAKYAQASVAENLAGAVAVKGDPKAQDVYVESNGEFQIKDWTQCWCAAMT